MYAEYEFEVEQEGPSGPFLQLNDHKYLCERECEWRAIKLLWRYLTPQQRKDLEEHDYFFCKGNKTNRKYKIKYTYGNFNVSFRKFFKFESRLCFIPDNFGPLGDKILTQKLMLELDEERVLKIANLALTSELRFHLCWHTY